MFPRAYACLLLRIIIRDGSQDQTVFLLLFLLIIYIFTSESPVWVPPVCHSVLTLLFISFSMCHSCPYVYPSWFPHTVFPVLSLLSCLLALAGISLPFHALFPPCRTRPQKAASAQSSRSGGEGGSVHVGMDSKHR